MKTAIGLCCEILFPGLSTQCHQEGILVRLACPAGRPDAVGGPYCIEHGGEARAKREAEMDWNYQAPARVGAAAAVEEAGHLHLDTRDAYLVLRKEAGKEGGEASDRWLAWLGVGSHVEGVRAPGSIPHRRRRETIEAYRTRCASQGGYAFLSHAEALTEAIKVWRNRLDQHVADIRKTRGGTLDWGIPVEPLSEPVILEVENGSAWDLAIAIPRRGRPGLCAISGLRPSGEAA